MIENPLPAAKMTRFLLENVKIDTAQNTICKGDEELSVEPRLIRVIAKLATHQGEIVSRAELLREISDVSVIGDESLTQAISKIRQYLGDSPNQPKFIKTIPKKGYLLLAPATPLTSETNEVSQQKRNGFVFGSRNKYRIAIAALFLFVGLVFTIFHFSSEERTFFKKGEVEFIEKVE